MLENPLWRRVRDFFRYWADATSPLYQAVPLVWLEFDHLAGSPSQVLPPGVNICLDPDYLNWSAWPPPGRRPESGLDPAWFDTVFELLLGRRAQAQTRQNVLTCFELLPAGGKILYVSVMLSRQPATVKLNGFIPKEGLPEYLAGIGWPGSVAQLKSILTTFCATLTDLRVDLTVGPQISSRVGLEFFSKGSTRPDQERVELLDQFVASGWCSPAKRDWLLSWSGFSTETFAHQAWATKLNRSWYAKIVCQAGRPVEAKGYLGFMPTFFSLAEGGV